ncbi:hypothetical protein QBC40DRAFT_283870 [Triangularia verruculosa]|uniref:Uncharacterized protein n=1 Tax=Triangularia verruculosa TaxID=2587418 RepID=A0AAN6XCS7_9PEZI|nr:hypothetical protein QBC40DRAFT_283870 [Triangularia verruculosa]
MARLPFQRKQSLPKSATPVEVNSDDEDDGDALALFRHSKEVFSEVIREAEEENRDRNNERKRKSSPCDVDENERRSRRRFVLHWGATPCLTSIADYFCTEGLRPRIILQVHREKSRHWMNQTTTL